MSTINKLDMSGDSEGSFTFTDYTEDQDQRRRFRSLTFYVVGCTALVFFAFTLYLACVAVGFYEPKVAANSSAKTPVVTEAKPATVKHTKQPALSNSQSTKAPQETKAPLTHSVSPLILENDLQPKTATDGMTHFLIMIGIIAAIGTTLALGIMRFVFAKQATDSEQTSGFVSPVAQSASEFISALAELVKKDKS